MIDHGVTFELPLTPGVAISPLDATLADESPGKVEVSVTSELMENYESGSPVRDEGRIQAVKDRGGDLLLFSIGDGGNLHLLRKEQGSHKGWKQHALNAGFRVASSEPGSEETFEEVATSVQAFAVEQLAGGDVAIALAAARRDAPGRKAIYFTPRLEDDPAKTVWHERAVADDLDVGYLKLGYDGRGGLQIFLSGKPTGQPLAQAFLVEAKAGAPTGRRPFPFPYDHHEILDACFGRMIGLDQGVYALHRYGERFDISFVQLEPKHGTTPARRIMPSVPNPTALAVLPAEFRGQTYTELYVSGRPNPKDPKHTLYVVSPLDQTRTGSHSRDRIEGDVIAAGLEQPLRQIAVARDEQGVVSLYARTGDGLLVHTAAEGKQAQTEEADSRVWAPLSVLDRDLLHVAPARNASTRIHELFVVRSSPTEAEDAGEARERTFSYLWQDAKTTLWKRDAAVLPATRDLRRVRAASTQINFHAPRASTFAEAKLRVESSECAVLASNGKTWFLDAGRPREITVGPDGNLTVTHRLESLNAPVLRITAPFLEQALDIQPLSRIKDRLKTVTPQQMIDARIGKDQKPLLDERLRDPAKLAPITKAFNELATLEPKRADPSRHLAWLAPDETGALLARMEREGVWLSDPGQPLTSDLDLDRLPQDYAWSLDLSSDLPVFRDAEATRREVLPRLRSLLDAATESDLYGAPSSNLERSLGNLFSTLWNLGKKVVGILVQKAQEGLEVLLDVAGRVYRFLARTLEQAFETISFVLKNHLGIDLEKIVQWLGFLFSWEDVRRTHDFLTKLVANTFETSKRQLPRLKGELDSFLRGLEKQAASLRELPAELRGADVTGYSSQLEGKLPPGEVEKARGTNRFVRTNPAATWGTHQLTGGQPQGVPTGLALPPLGESVKQALLRFAENVARPVAGETQKMVEESSARIEALWNSGSLTLDRLLLELGSTFIEKGIALTRQAAAAFLDLLTALVGAIQSLLDFRIDIPVLTPLYENVIAPGHKLTAADAFLLAVAIPVTLTGKLLTGKAPFEGMTAPGVLADENDQMAVANADERTLKAVTLWASGVGGYIVGSIGWIFTQVRRILSFGKADEYPLLKDALYFADALVGILRTGLSFPYEVMHRQQFAGEKAATLAIWIVLGLNEVCGLIGLLLAGINALLGKAFSSLRTVIFTFLTAAGHITLLVLRILHFKATPTKLVQPISLVVQLGCGWVATIPSLVGTWVPKPEIKAIAYAIAIVFERVGLTIYLGRNILGCLTHYEVVVL